MGAYDISRVAFDPRKHYAGVRMQQGRVLTDDDWNENERIENEERRRSRVDIIGPHGSPDLGFKIVNPRLTPEGQIEFGILPGAYHLGGLRLEMEFAKGAPDPQPETFRAQKDWLQQAHGLLPKPGLNAGGERYDLVYLQAWQQAVSAVEDSELLEVALGGPDTATRIRNMRRVLVQPDIGFSDCPRAWQKLVKGWTGQKLGYLNQENELLRRVQLTVSYNEEGASDDLCAPAVAGGYLGAENQAIRVQLLGPDKLIWGFDNAAPLYRVIVKADDQGHSAVLKMLTPPKDQHHWPLAGQTVEVLPWSAVLPNREKAAAILGHRSRVDASYDPDSGEFTLSTPLPTGFGEEWKQRSDSDTLTTQDTQEYFYLRVWNRADDLESAPELTFTPGTPLPLGHTGLSVTIEGEDRVAGDYWVIAARPETPGQVVPWQLENGMPPLGIRGYYAPLAIIRWYLDQREVKGEVIQDCRKKFRPLTDLESCCTYAVGDGLASYGDFTTIEEAVANLPAAGGKICVLAGQHLANVDLKGRHNIRISGCGERTIIRPRLRTASEPIFRIDTCQKIELDNLSLVTSRGAAIEVVDTLSDRDASQKIDIHDNTILAAVHAIHIKVTDTAEDNDIHIAGNRIGMIDKAGGKTAIFSIADGVCIERNRLVVVPSQDPDNPTDPRPPLSTGDDPFFDPCAEDKEDTPTFSWAGYISHLQQFIVNAAVFQPRKLYQAWGGIQIGGTSERIRILHNEIIGGRGNGIILGHLPELPVYHPPVVKAVAMAPPSSAYEYPNEGLIIDQLPNDQLEQYLRENFQGNLYEITIEDNHIRSMGLSGIGVVAYLRLQAYGLLVQVNDLAVNRNRLANCCRQLPSSIPQSMYNEVAYGGITLTAVENAVIQHNRIQENGISHLEPICGIFTYYGENMDISHNRILNNGPRTDNRNIAGRRGSRGGIVIRKSMASLQIIPLDEESRITDDRVPALVVHRNIVHQPLGQALSAMFVGAVSITDNQFSTQGVDYRDPEAMVAGAVFLMGLGTCWDMVKFRVLPLLERIVKGEQAVNLAASKAMAIATNEDQEKATALIQMFTWLLTHLPDSPIQFNNNQVVLDVQESQDILTISAQFLFSYGDIAFNDNYSACLLNGENIQRNSNKVVINTLLWALSTRSNNNRFMEDTLGEMDSLLSYAHMNTALGNQSTNCLCVFGKMVPGANLLESSNLQLRVGEACSRTCKDNLEFIEIPLWDM